ncbi:RNA-directed DNA polymerase, eukaryota [Tanacetum coccineum]
MGDFNEVRSKEERLGSNYNQASSRFFNQFITSSGLVDVNLEGYAFTWSHPSATKMSKLDRFLVSEGIISLFPSLTALCLDRHLSDHRPILLREILTDYGPTPFRFYHSWFKWDGFDAMVEQAWNSLSHSDSNGLIRFKKKLQDLKKIIRNWVKVKKLQQAGSIKSIKDELTDIDKSLDSGYAIEGDENSKFFHGIINKKRSQLSIRGVFVDGNWITDPGVVKDAFKDHFAARFKQPLHDRLKLNILFTNRLSTKQAVDMDRRDIEVCSPAFCFAVEGFFDNGKFLKGCNSSFIALIPKVPDAKFVTDFRPISLIRCVYKVVTKILANRLATVISDLVSDIQSAFVANRQILDGPFILNELLTWCKKKKKQALVFKVDFAKAYDSVRWDYLLDVLHAFGFGPNWYRWIRGTFSSAMASILVNGIPSSEFPFFCRLKQGDPLAPYLFILIMESLHISFSRAINDRLFKGVHIQGSVSLSHIFYVDDVVFIGEWSDSNMVNIVKTHSVGGRLTLLKSVLGASPLYNMSIYRVPKGVLEEMEAIRSNFFIGANTLERKIAWLSWDKVLASKKNGGLGVSSFHALNHTLLLKWVWHFLSQDGSLWYRVIQALYGPSLELHPSNHSSIWFSILRENRLLNSKGFDFGARCKKRVGDGQSTRFWHHNWVSEIPLRVRFPHLFALDTNKEASVASKLGSSSIDVSFRRSVREGVEREQWND